MKRYSGYLIAIGLLLTALFPQSSAIAASRSYQNKYFPLAVDNYWIYRRAVENGYVLTEERVIQEIERLEHRCYVMRLKQTQYTDGSKTGITLEERENLYCLIENDVFDVCMKFEDNNYLDIDSYSFIKRKDPNVLLLKLPGAPKVDFDWVTHPYEEKTVSHKILGFQDVFNERLIKRFDDCVQLKLTVAYNPRRNRFEWYCPYVGRARDILMRMHKDGEEESLYGELTEYRVR